MEHVAIMKRSWGLTEKILTDEKKIESRWYTNKKSPWNKIKLGEVIYFKNSGENVTIKAKVKKVLQFSDLTAPRVKLLLKKYRKRDGITAKDVNKFYQVFKNKKFCILIFLKNPKKVKPFEINKTGFGSMSAWISVQDINSIKK